MGITEAARPLRGARLSSFYPPVDPEGPSLADLDSAFQLQEYISLLIRKDPHDVDAIVACPGKLDVGDDVSGEKEGRSDVVVDVMCWIYEQLRWVSCSIGVLRKRF